MSSRNGESGGIVDEDLSQRNGERREESTPVCTVPEQLPAGYEKISSYSDTDFVLTKDEEFNVDKNMFKCAEGYDGTATVGRCTSIPGDVVFTGCAKNTVQVGESRGDEEGEEEPTPVCTVPERSKLI